MPPHSPVELAEGTSSPLALALYETLTRNAAQLGKLEGRVLVRAEDTDSAVTLDFAGGRVRVSEGEPESPGIRILGDEDAILALGIARAGLDAYGERLRTRMTSFPPIIPAVEDPDHQFWYGKAAGLIGTAEAATERVVQQWTELSAEPAEAVEQDLLVEDVSIDGMCGVY